MRQNAILGATGVYTYSDCERRGLMITCIYKCDDSSCVSVGDGYTAGQCFYDLIARKNFCQCKRD